MTLIQRFARWLINAAAMPPSPTVTTPKPKPKRMSNAQIERVTNALRASGMGKRHELAAAEPFPNVVPKDKLSGVMAMDLMPYGMINGANTFQYVFPGYPYLAELSQIAEYRLMASKRAKEMTREWIKVVSLADDEADNDDTRTERINQIEQALDRYQIRAKFCEALEKESYFGRIQLYLDMKVGGSNALAIDDPLELEQPLFISSKKIAKGSFNGITIVEPMWSYPGVYNADTPLKANYYKPEKWYVMGLLVDHTRLLTMISNPVPDMLKSSYSFGGISLSQMAQPYVDNWLRTRQSVSDAIHAFSTSGLATDLSSLLSDPSGEEGQLDVIKRSELFNLGRDNKGLMLINKDDEEFFQFNMPLSGLDKLQAQAQEQMSAVASMPLVKLLGITPAGLNANSDGEIRVWYDYVASEQEDVIRPPLKTIIDVIQLSEFGEIDEGIGFQFVPLFQLTDLERATVRKTDAETDVALIGVGVIDPEESRERVANDEDSPYSSIDISKMPEPIEEPTDDNQDPAGAPPSTGKTGKGKDKPASKDAGPGKAKRGD